MTDLTAKLLAFISDYDQKPTIRMDLLSRPTQGGLVNNIRDLLRASAIAGTHLQDFLACLLK